RSFGAYVRYRQAHSGTELLLYVEIPLLHIAVAERILHPGGAGNRGRERAAVRVRQADVRDAGGALVKAVGGQERRRQVGVENHVENLEVPEQAPTGPNDGLRAERRPGKAGAWREFALRRIVNGGRLRRGDAQE